MLNEALSVKFFYLYYFFRCFVISFDYIAVFIKGPCIFITLAWTYNVYINALLRWWTWCVIL